MKHRKWVYSLCKKDWAGRMENSTANFAARILSDTWHPRTFHCVEIAGVPVIDTTRSEITDEMIFCTLAAGGRCRTLFFLNAHSCNFSFIDRDYAGALENATWILNDGIGMDMAARLQGQKFTENLNGSDLINEGEFLRHCAKECIGVFLLGARQEILDLAVDRYRTLFPGLKIVGAQNGYFGHQDEACSLDVVARINASGAKVLLVGLGNPIQEHWLDRYRNRLGCRLAIGIGGSIDQVSGIVPRASRFWIRLRLEWFFRLCREPRRLWRRYLVGNVLFLVRIILRRKSLYSRSKAMSVCD